MKSIKEIYRIGTGPSSSHTMGPRKAAEHFLSLHPEAESFEVDLFGSLAATGKGHMTDVAILDTLEQSGKPVKLNWKPDIFLPYHPNGLVFRSYDADGNISEEWTVYSVGGGAIEGEGLEKEGGEDVYSKNTLSEIMEYCERSGRCYWEYVDQCEGKEINDYLLQVWE
ncbi:MAG: serine dehydratase, partial [Muribaculaceae bacterium]|nr:serine dehydratase [Muribaculaceae bacterium]